VRLSLNSIYGIEFTILSNMVKFLWILEVCTLFELNLNLIPKEIMDWHCWNGLSPFGSQACPAKTALIVEWVPIFWEVRVSRLVKISTLMTKALNSVGSNPCSHYTTAPLVTNPCTHELASSRRLCPCKRIENTSKNRKEQSRIADEWLAHESWGLTNRMSVKLFLID
jgi:hypothetical protein